MANQLNYPKLRWPIDLRVEKIDAREILIVSCPLGISREPLGLLAAVAPIVGQFEGRLSIDEITAKFQRYGVERKLVEELVELLDRHCFMESPRFYAAEREMREGYARSTVREPALAGLSYPADERALAAEIDQWLAHGSAALAIPGRQMIGLVSPHIDYRRGGVAYGKTYVHAKPEEHDLYILIGTGHQYSKHLFHLSSKDFASPLGILPCDREFVRSLAGRYGAERSFADEILHRREHSLELQAPFLRRLKNKPTIVPILVGGFHQMVAAGKMPEEYEVYDAFAAGLAECVRERIGQGRRVCFLSGVDMAHVGRAFGDTGSLTPEFMEQIAARDRRYLDAVSAQDKHALFAHIAEDGDARRMCGFPTLYTVIDCLDRLGLRCTAELFDYRQAVDYKTDCAVTFAGLGMYASAVAAAAPSA